MKLRKKQPADREAPRRSPSRGSSSPVFSYYAGGRTRSAQSRRSSYASPKHHRTDSGRTPSSSSAAGSAGPSARSGGWPMIVRRFFGAFRRLQLRHIPSYVALIAVVAGVFWTLSLSSSPRVVVEPVSGVLPKRDASQYTEGVSAIWSDSWRNATKLTADTHSTEQDILQTYTELSDVRVQLPLLGRRPTIVLAPTAAVLRLESGGTTYYVSPEGRALLDSSVVDAGANLPIIRDETGVPVAAGQQIMPRDSARFVVQLFAQLKAEGVANPSLTLSSQAVNQITLTTSDHSYYVKFQITDPTAVRQAVGSYIAVRNRLNVSGTTPGEYMDVRIPEKVFYK